MGTSHQAIGEHEPPPTAPTSKAQRASQPAKVARLVPPPKDTVPLAPVPSFSELVEDRRSPLALDAGDEEEVARIAAMAKAATTIDPLNIEAEFIAHPGHLAFWNARLALAWEAKAHADAERERMHGRLYVRRREQLNLDGDKVTEALLAETVACDQKYTQVVADAIEAERAWLQVRGVVRAAEEKGRMLMSLGAHIREEMKGDPSVRREERSKRQSVQSAAPDPSGYEFGTMSWDHR